MEGDMATTNEMSDFWKFKKFITPVVIQIIFWIGIVLCIISGIIGIVRGATANYGGGSMVLLGVFTIILGPLFVRVYCEILIIIFQIFDVLKQIAKKGGK
jgi:hypothetical protein